MRTPSEAEALIAAHVFSLPVQVAPLGVSVGSVLQQDVIAERDHPPFDRVAMDGIAVDSAAVRAGLRRLQVVGAQVAGEPSRTLPAITQCFEVMTGAVLPRGCDAVVPFENVTIADGTAHIADGIDPKRWLNVHRRASDRGTGARLLASGLRLGASEVAIAAGAGLSRIRVSEQPKIAVVSTGDELVEPGEPILPHQIRRSNAHGVAAALHRHGFVRVVVDHVTDDFEQMRRILAHHLEQQHVLILSGGVSMGKLDLVPRVLASLGVHEVFHRVAQRPGKPLWFGHADGRLVFGLPGNPVATFACVARYVIPALNASMGLAAPPPSFARLAHSVAVSHSMVSLIPVRIEVDGEACVVAHPSPSNGSGDLCSLAQTHGVVELPAGPSEFGKGFIGRVFHW